MNRVKAIFTLIRFPNLVFVVLTQLFTYQFIILHAMNITHSSIHLSFSHFLILCFSTFLIAAAGYIINDYFDISIDAVNKPHKVTIEKIFKRRHVIIWHIVLNLLGLILAAYVAIKYLQLRFIGYQLLCILLLVFYSTTFKRKLIIGNLTIAILTSLTVYIVAVYEPSFEIYNFDFPYTKLFWVYIVFSFFITLIREIIKDIEDVKGDSFQHCQTIPLVFGISKAKTLVYFLFLIISFFLLITSIYFFSFNKILSLFLLATVFAPTIFIVYKLFQAKTSKEFHQISSYIKWVTLFGIISMIFI